MALISSYQDSIYNSSLKENVKGFVDFQKIKNLDYLEGYVLKWMEYRPDLVASYYLNDSSLSWIITCFNGFTNGIEDYKAGKKLKIPRV